MGYWGWRPLVFGLFISAWVVGCNIVTNHASPSAYPNITLTVGRLPTARVSAAPTRAAPTPVFTPAATEESTQESNPSPSRYVVQPGDTLANIAAQFNISLTALVQANEGIATLVPGQTLLIPATALPALLVQPPICYQIRPDHLLCLGRIDNPLDFPVESVAVEVRLLQANGSVLNERSTVDQIDIPSGSFAPYQATFEATWSDSSSVDASLISATHGAKDRFVVLLIQDVKNETVDGRVVVSAIIYNPGSQNAELLRAFVTLLDSLGRVIGYRVSTFAAGVILDAGAHLPLKLDLVPQVSGVTPDYSLYVEARAQN